MLNKIVAELERSMQCFCDLDKWEPEHTGHTFVCPIHKEAMRLFRLTPVVGDAADGAPEP